MRELVFRGKTWVQKQWERRTFDAERFQHMLAKLPPGPSIDDWRQGNGLPRFFFVPEREECRQYFLRSLPDEKEKSLKRAQQFLKLKFNMLGVSFQYTKKIDWHADPVTGDKYDKRFYQDIDIYLNNGVTDIKHVWEVNRHQFFIELAKAYFLTGEYIYARKVLDLWLDWIKENPYKNGVNWTSALEVAVRAYSWLWSLFFLIDSPLLTDEVIQKFYQAFYLHAHYISENLSFYSSPYNHLIGELSALYMISSIFPHFPESVSWKRQSWQILTEQISRQFHEDGICVEQASFYHHFTLGFFLMPMIHRQCNNEPVPEQMKEMVRHVMEWNLAFTRPDGTIPSIGDIDNARSIYFTNPENWNFRNFLAIGAVFFQEHTLKQGAGNFWEDVLWLFGISGVQVWEAIEGRWSHKKVFWFPKSGYLVGRSEWKPDAHFFWMDVGEIADGVFPDMTPSAAHGQADLLHFEITAFGKNFIVDPGFHNYRGNFEWHRYFRLTRAHNTIEIDEHSQARHGDIMVWSHCPQPQILHFQQDEQWFFLRATHNGFRELKGRPQHIRNFFFIFDRMWVVVDEIRGVGEHQIDSYLHFHADATVNIDWPFLDIRLKKERLIGIQNGPLNQYELYKGGELPEEGWVSHLYRHRQPAPVMCIFQKMHLPVEHAMAFVPAYSGTTVQQMDEGVFHLEHKKERVSIAFEHLKDKTFATLITFRVFIAEESQVEKEFQVQREDTKWLITVKEHGKNGKKTVKEAIIAVES